MKTSFVSLCGALVIALVMDGCGGSGQPFGFQPGGGNPSGGISPHYRIYPVGPSGAKLVTPVAINASEQVVATTKSGGVSWDPSTFLTSDLSGGLNASPVAINDSGLIIGNYPYKAGTIGCYWPTGSLTPFAVGDYGAQYGVISGLNNSNEIVGYVSNQPPNVGNSGGIWYYSSGLAVTTLNRPADGASYQAYAISDSHMIVGQMNTSAFNDVGGPIPAFWSSTSASQPTSESVAKAPAVPTAINAAGQIIGGTLGSAVFWNSDGAPETVLAQFGSALGINAAGTVVGNKSATAAGPTSAFIWTQSSGLVDLNTLVVPATSGPEWRLTSANAINATGWVVGVGTVNGQPSGFIAEPLAK